MAEYIFNILVLKKDMNNTPNYFFHQILTSQILHLPIGFLVADSVLCNVLAIFPEFKAVKGYHLQAFSLADLFRMLPARLPVLHAR